ncbi:MAG: YcaO-like family protein [Myxococcales bacterium]|nr:YcaO-like family protein [Myxococcales bacterium]
MTGDARAAAWVRAAAADAAGLGAVLRMIGPTGGRVSVAGPLRPAIEAALGASGAWVMGEGGALWIHSGDGWDAASHRAAEDAARAAGVPVLHVAVAGGVATAGPLVEPGGDPCFHCWRYRALTHAADPRAAVEAEAAAFAAPVAAALDGEARGRLARAAVVMAAMRLAGSEGGLLPRGLVYEAGPAPGVRWLLRRDDCPECAAGEARGGGDVLARAHRLVDRRFGPVVAVRLGQVPGGEDGSTEGGMWQAEVERANLRLATRRPGACYGRGLSAEACLRSALGEAVERQALSAWGAARGARRAGVPVFGGAGGDGMGDGWLDGRRFPGGAACDVPAAAVFGPDSTGLAAHGEPAAAALGALLEVVERDAFIVAWEGGAVFEACDPMSHPEAAVRALVEAERAAGHVLHLARVPSAPGVAVFAATSVARVPSPAVPAHAVGLGAHVSGAAAARAALLEATQVRYALARRLVSLAARARMAALGAGAAVVDPIDHGLLAAHPASGAAVARLCRGAARRLPGGEEVGVTAALAALGAVFAGRPAAVVEVTPPTLAAEGWTVARAVWPGGRRISPGPASAGARERRPHPFC